MELYSESYARSINWIRCARELSSTSSTTAQNHQKQQFFDVDCNLTHDALRGDVVNLLNNAKSVGIKHMLVPSSCTKDYGTFQAIMENTKGTGVELLSTVGVHPYNVLTETMPLDKCLEFIKSVSESIAAVGECGLDFSDGFPEPEIQQKWFEPQVELACELNKPLFLHERLAHEPFMRVLKKYESKLPPVLVHCFTGNARELETYLDMGFYISVSGIICRKKAGQEVRQALSKVDIPLDKIMIETDAPYLGFPGCRGNEANETKKAKKNLFPNVPSSLPMVCNELANVLRKPSLTVSQNTMLNAAKFFRLVVKK